MRLTWQLTLLGVVLLLAVPLAITLLVTDLYSQSYREQTAEHSNGLHQILAETLAGGVIRSQTLEVERLLQQGQTSEPGVAYLYITDFDGRLFAHTFATGFPRALLPTLKNPQHGAAQRRFRTEEAVIDHYSAPLIDGMSARLHLGMSDSHYLENLAQLHERVILTALSVAALGLLLGAFIVRRFSSPLTRLTVLVNRFGRGEPVAPEDVLAGGALELRQLRQAVAGMMRERDALEKSLKAREGYVRMLFETSPVGLALTRMDGTLVEVNPMYARTIGRSVEETIGLTYWEITPEEYHEQEQAQLKSLERFGRYGHYEKEYLHQDGHRVPVRLSGRLIERDGEQYIWSVVEDITEQRQAAAEIERQLQALRKSEIRLAESQHIARIGNWDLNLLTDELWWSDEIFRIFEIDRDRFDATYEGFLDAIHPQDREEVNRAYTESVSDRSRYDVVHRLLMSDSRIKYVHERCETFYDEMGTALRSIGTIQDVTEGKQAEMALAASEEKFRNLVETSQDWVWEVDTQGVYTYASPRCRELLGYEPEEIVGRTPFELMPETKKKKFRAVFQRITTEAVPIIALENVNLHKDGHEVVLETSGIPFFDRRGTLAGYRGMDRDITERKQAEIALKREYERTRLILETTLDGYILADTLGRLLDTNPAYCRLVGYARNELLSMNIRQLDTALTNDEMSARIQAMVAAGGARFETCHRHRDGRDVELDVNIAIMHVDETPLVAAFVRDITERKRAEQNLHYRMRLEAAVAKVSSELVQAGDDGLDAAIDKTLEHIGSVLDADRGYLFEVDEAADTLSNIHEWRAEGVLPQQLEPQRLPMAAFQPVLTRFREGDALHVPDPEGLDDELAPLREFMRQTGIRSLINVPVLWDGRLRGVVGFDSEKTRKEWPKEDIQLLHTVADNFGWALASREASRRIREHAWFLENLDRVSSMLSEQQHTTQLLQHLTGLILEIFAVDKAWLLHPCNPGAPAFQTPIETTRPEFSDAFAEGIEVPMDDLSAEMMRQALSLDRPLIIHSEEVADPPDYIHCCQIQSLMVMALHIQIGDPWLLGVHQCSRKRVWTAVEQRLFQTIAERVRAALSRSQLLEQVRESARRLTEAEHIAVMGSWELDIATGRARWSDEVHQLVGTDPSQEVGPALLATIVNPEDWPAVQSSLTAAMKEGKKHEMEYRIMRPDGRERWIYCKAERRLDAEGNPAKLSGIAQDITERVSIEKELESHRQHLEQLVEERTSTIRQQAQIIAQTHDSVVTTDLDGYVTSWNGGAERLFGTSAANAMGRHVSFIYPEYHHEFLENEVIAPLKEKGMHEAEVRMLHADGSEIPVHLSLSLLYDDAGVSMGMVGYAMDLSELKRREEELDRLASRLQVSNKELESFSYSASHDLRAPLRAIDGFSLALAEDYGDRLDSTALDYLQRVRSGAQRMGRLIDDLLQLSRVNRGELQVEEADLAEIAEAVLEELRAGEPGRQVALTLGPDMRARGDARLLRVMLDNLLGNAWKFTSRETTAHITFKRQTDDPEVFFISDNGAGFDIRHADKLFGAFQRLHRVTDFPGTGVGLATVQRIVHRHGGRIWAEAQEGEGATFYFSLGPTQESQV